MSTGVVITGSGTWHPAEVLENDELCTSFNAWVKAENERNADAIAAGEVSVLRESTPEFVVKASGIQRRYTHDKAGVLDVERMYPRISARPDAELSVQAEYGAHAARAALMDGGRVGEDIDLIICAGACMQRYFPAMGIEIQNEIGARGFGYDVLAGCSSATFPVQQAVDAIRGGSANKALTVNPELLSPFSNWRDRDSHFIFGDASASLMLERADECEGGWEILGTKLLSRYSTNIRNNLGYLNRCEDGDPRAADKLFYQQGRRVFKDIVPLAAQFISEHLAEFDMNPEQVRRYWLHQANANLNNLIIKRLLGSEPTPDNAPLVIDEWGNTASAGSLIAFSLHNKDLKSGDIGVLCSFGAGYSIGNVILRKR